MSNRLDCTPAAQAVTQAWSLGFPARCANFDTMEAYIHEENADNLDMTFSMGEIKNANGRSNLGV